MNVNPYQSPQPTITESRTDQGAGWKLQFGIFEKSVTAWICILLVAAIYHARITDVQVWLKSPFLPMVIFGSLGALLLVPICLLRFAIALSKGSFAAALIALGLCLAAFVAFVAAMFIDRAAFIQ